MYCSSLVEFLLMKVIPLYHSAPEWNFSYIIHGKSKEHCILIDPGASNKTHDFLKNHLEYRISHILVSHKHDLHTGDLPSLLTFLKDKDNEYVEVVSGWSDAKEISEATITIKEKMSINIKELVVMCIPAPCHTLGSLMYYIEAEGNSGKDNDRCMITKEEVNCYRAVFTGDTLFIGGCGHFCEGNARMMAKNFETLQGLPAGTFIFPGHEYTVKNLKWAMGIEWENEEYEKKLKWAEEKQSKKEYTIPSTIEEEFKTNIFWRTGEKIVQERTGCKDSVEVLAKLREMKDKMVSLKK